MTITEPQPTTVHPHLGVRQDILDSVEAILPTLARNASRAEAERTVPHESYAALLESNALRLFAPRRFGGPEANYRTYVEVTSRVAGACGASGWLCFILNHADWNLGQMTASAQETVWANGNGIDDKVLSPLSPSLVSARKVEGGTMVSGEWPYSSGSDRAKWALIGYPMVGADGIPVLECGLISTVGLELKDTWYVTGMAGTSSNTLVVPETFIPEEHVITMGDMVAGNFKTPYPEEPLYRQDVALVFHFATLAPVLGLAKAAFDLTLERITTKRKPQSYTFYPDSTKSPANQTAMARAGWLVDTAFDQARAVADEMDAKAAAGVRFESTERARHIMRVAQAHRMCREAMDLILDVGGAGSFALANPVQRMWRDMSVATRHGLSVPGLKEELYGRSLLGADEQQMTPIR